MARVPDVAPERMSDEQKRLAEIIGGSRGGVVRGPFAIWLRQPALAAAANQLGNTLRLDGKLDRSLFELAILLVARKWKAQYEWFAHEKAALEAGLPASVIEAIRIGQPVPYETEDQRVVAAMVADLHASGKVSDAVYARTEKHFGLNLMIELVSVMGFYTMVAVVLNAFDAPVPDGLQPLPELDGAFV